MDFKNSNQNNSPHFLDNKTQFFSITVMKKKPILTFKIESDQDQWHAYCPELPGCHSFGATPEEAIKNLKNAVQIYIEDEIECQGFEEIIGDKTTLVHV